MTFQVPEECRVKSGLMASDSSYGNKGAFVIKGPRGFKLNVIASDGLGWEHVSVSVIDANRCPTWDEMCSVKDIFWGDDDCVVQYHPPKSDYVNNHPYVLHLWRQIGVEFNRPPRELVGVRPGKRSLATASLVAMTLSTTSEQKRTK